MNVLAPVVGVIKQMEISTHHLVHVGAHQGQEVPLYQEAGIQNITLVEPHPTLARKLKRKYPKLRVVQAALSDRAGTRKLHVYRKTNLSTLNKPSKDDKFMRDINVRTMTLSDVAPDATIAVIDTQGHELSILRGVDWTHSNIELLVVETSTVHDPTMASDYEEVFSYLSQFGFTVHDYWVRDYQYINKWARGTSTSEVGEIRDVVFVR